MKLDWKHLDAAFIWKLWKEKELWVESKHTKEEQDVKQKELKLSGQNELTFWQIPHINVSY